MGKEMEKEKDMEMVNTKFLRVQSKEYRVKRALNSALFYKCLLGNIIIKNN